MKIEIELTGHTDEVGEKLGGWPAGITARQLKENRNGQSFLIINSEVPADRLALYRVLQFDVARLNGHLPEQLGKFHPGLGSPEAGVLLKAIHEANSEITKLGTERGELAAKSAALEKVMDETDVRATVDLYFEQIEIMKRQVRKLDAELKQERNKLSNNKRTLVELAKAESAQKLANCREIVRVASSRANALIMQAYQIIADEVAPAVREMAEEGQYCGVAFSPETGYFDTQILQRPRDLYNFNVAPQLKLTDTALRFEIRNVTPTGGKK
jgi:hypothetical protein